MKKNDVKFYLIVIGSRVLFVTLISVIVYACSKAG
jgi:hypothetical protein